MKKFSYYFQIARWNGYVVGWYFGYRPFLFDALMDRAIRKSKEL